MTGFLVMALAALPGCQEALGVTEDSSQSQKIDAPVAARLNEAGTIPVAILLQTQLLLGPDGLTDFIADRRDEPRSQLRSEVMQTLRATAHREQAELHAAMDLPENARGLWIANAIFVSLTAEQIREAAAQDVVRFIYLMQREPASYDQPGTVGTVLTPSVRPPFSAAGKQIPWNVERIGASRVWEELGVTGEGVVVAMIDNGSNYTQPDLAGNIWINPDEAANNGVDDDGNGLIDDYYGFNFFQGRAEVQLDPSNGRGAGHGTWTSGIVLGDGTGGVVTGLAPRARLMVTVGGGDTYAVGRAFEYALAEGADVATMSFSIPGLENVRGLWRLMADHAAAAGLVLVSGAGNFQQSAPVGVQQRIPEGIPSVISVGGVDQSLELASFSSLGPVSWSTVMFYGDHSALIKPDVAGFPGPEFPLIRAEGAGYRDPNDRRGNSFSGPHAAGVAALMLSANPELRAWEVKEIMEATAEDLAPDGRDNRTGAGLIDAFEAVSQALARR